MSQDGKRSYVERQVKALLDRIDDLEKENAELKERLAESEEQPEPPATNQTTATTNKPKGGFLD